VRTIQAILHPTDFSESSEQALRAARGLARSRGARLVLLHVVEPETIPAELIGADPRLEEARREIEERAARLGREEPGLVVEGRVSQGPAVGEVLALAAETRCDLIVMGSHGRTGLARALMGSVAESVARGARCPVLIVKAPRPPAGAASAAAPYRAILVPTDFTARSREALDLAGSLAGEGTRVIVLHVVVAVHVAAEGLELALEERLRALSVPGPGVRMEYRLREGDAADEVLGEARASSADLVVMASHGRTGLDRLLVGSVAGKVMAGAACPVMILRTPTPAD
jgi:nucleotide-binding universal stress UspA family protein